MMVVTSISPAEKPEPKVNEKNKNIFESYCALMYSKHVAYTFAKEFWTVSLSAEKKQINCTFHVRVMTPISSEDK